MTPHDIIRDGVGWLSDALQRSAGVKVVYRRGGLKARLCVSLGGNVRYRRKQTPVTLEWDERMFLVPAASLILAGQRATPMRGDLIEYDGEVYAVAGSDQEPPRQYVDQHTTMWRVRAKRVS